MIKYVLVCSDAHEFESWFPDSAAFETQARRGLVACPECGSTKVGKAIMAPAVARRDRRVASRPEPEAGAPETPPPQPVALVDERQLALQAMLRDLRTKIVENTVDVGQRFPEEARLMHGGDAPVRSIRGEASAEEARALLEEGIDILPIPRFPDELN